MEYKHTQFDESVNVSPNNPIKAFVAYSAAIAMLIAVLYVVSFGLIEIAVSYVSKDTEQRIWSAFFKDHYFTQAQTKEAQKTQKYLQGLLDRIPKKDLPDYRYEIIVMDEPQMNAMALPSGKIIVNMGLVKRLKSENALTFVIGHELGHFAHRDHLRRLGGGLLAGLVMLPFTSTDGSSALLDVTGRNVESYFSRTRESDADMYAMDALRAVYGHAGGATELFEILKQENLELLFMLSTHPMSQERIEHMHELIKKERIPLRPVRAKNI